MVIVYLYDGSFEGLLTTIYDHYYVSPALRIYDQLKYQTNLLDKTKIIVTNEVKWKKVFSALKSKFTEEALNHIHYTFLSMDSEKDTYLLNYVVYGFKIGSLLDNQHTHPSVLPVHQLSKRVSFEVHRFLGLLRFSDISGTLYAAIEPDNDIITLMVEHFADRLKNERFIIHDKKRKKAVVYYNYNWMLRDFPDMDLTLNENERYFRELWKGYFRQIAIEERKNLRLQQQFVPKKYRKNITEFQPTGKI